jgi:hypothetical protein
MSNQEPDMFAQVFSQKALILAAFGALGGSVRAAVLKTGWRESLRVIFVGGAVAFGVGIFGPSVMSPIFGPIDHDAPGSMGALTASAFLLGLVSVTIVERVFTKLWGGDKS